MFFAHARKTRVDSPVGNSNVKEYMKLSSTKLILSSSCTLLMIPGRAKSGNRAKSTADFYEEDRDIWSEGGRGGRWCGKAVGRGCGLREIARVTGLWRVSLSSFLLTSRQDVRENMLPIVVSWRFHFGNFQSPWHIWILPLVTIFGTYRSWRFVQWILSFRIGWQMPRDMNTSRKRQSQCLTTRLRSE